jgi:hypothetical protein
MIERNGHKAPSPSGGRGRGSGWARAATHQASTLFRPSIVAIAVTGGDPLGHTAHRLD